MLFYSRAPPDVSAQARVVIVLALSDTTNKDYGSPANAGHLISDFFAEIHIFKGMGSKTTAIMSSNLHPDVLVKKYLTTYKNYLHGDITSLKNRKIVFNEEIWIDWKKNELPQITDRPTDSLMVRTINVIVEESRKAAQENVPLTVMINGHAVPGGLILFDGNEKYGQYLTPEMIAAKLDRKARVTLFMSSCFAGAWCVCPDLNATVFAARQNKQASHTFAYSLGLSRASDSGFVASFIDQITQGPDEQRITERKVKAEPHRMRGSQVPSLARWSMELYKRILTLDITIAETGLSFTAQDDDWEANYNERTGFPRSSYAENYDALQDYQGDSAALVDSYNALARGFTQKNIDAAFCYGDIRRKAGNSDTAVIDAFCNDARYYLTGFNGGDESISNRQFHLALKAILDQPDLSLVEMEEVEEWTPILQYRLD